VDVNFVKIHLLSHFGDHVRRLGNNQMYCTQSGKTSQKRINKEGCCWSNRNDLSHQILRTCGRLDSCKIHEMNVKASIPHPIQNKLPKTQHQWQVGSVTKQLSGLAPTVENISQLNMILRNLPDLFQDYFGLKSCIGHQVEIGEVLQFSVEICRLLRVLVAVSQDAQEVTWHRLWCTGTQLWRATRPTRND